MGGSAGMSATDGRAVAAKSIFETDRAACRSAIGGGRLSASLLPRMNQRIDRRSFQIPAPPIVEQGGLQQPGRLVVQRAFPPVIGDELRQYDRRQPAVVVLAVGFFMVGQLAQCGAQDSQHPQPYPGYSHQQPSVQHLLLYGHSA